jgi:hypothetical protein
MVSILWFSLFSSQGFLFSVQREAFVEAWSFFSLAAHSHRQRAGNQEIIRRSHFKSISKSWPECRGVRSTSCGNLRHRRGSMTHAGLAVMAVTVRLGPARNLEGSGSLPIPNPKMVL